MRALFIVAAAIAAPLFSAPAVAAPTSVTLAGDFQSELGCPGDFQANCALSALVYDATDDVWQRALNLPAGNFGYIAALNGGFAESYGKNATPGVNVTLNLAAPSTVKFYYDDKSHWVTDDVNSVIAVLAGDFQSELGCPGDFQADCLRSWLQDVDGDGIYTFVTDDLPAGNYSTVVAIDESFTESYGKNGVPGVNIDFTVPASGTPITFSYDPITHILTITPDGSVVAVPEPVSATMLGTALAGLAFFARRKRQKAEA